MSAVPFSSTVWRGITAGAGRVLRSRRLARAPIWLYRARLGFLFGDRMLMLEHVGRKSGRRRYVVLEVMDRPARDEYVVPSGFGTRAQWFRNVQATPRVRVFAGGRGPVQATARMLTAAEREATLRAYVARHPRAWSRFKTVVESTLGSTIDDRATELPMVGLRLERTGTPEGTAQASEKP